MAPKPPTARHAPAKPGRSSLNPRFQVERLGHRITRATPLEVMATGTILGLPKGYENDHPGPFCWSDGRMCGHGVLLGSSRGLSLPGSQRGGRVLPGCPGRRVAVGVRGRRIRHRSAGGRTTAAALGATPGAMETSAPASRVRALRRAAALRALHARPGLGADGLGAGPALAPRATSTSRRPSTAWGGRM
jgi:hypothetical protein